MTFLRRVAESTKVTHFGTAMDVIVGVAQD
jgi:hypothetical protein